MMKASQVIYNMIKANNGMMNITTYKGKEHKVFLSKDGACIYSKTALRKQEIKLTSFDDIVNFIKFNGGTVRKGGGRDSKVGEGKCTSDTLMYFIATEIYGHTIGQSTFDPVFVIAAILDNTNIAKNMWGKIKLNDEYR